MSGEHVGAVVDRGDGERPWRLIDLQASGHEDRQSGASPIVSMTAVGATRVSEVALLSHSALPGAEKWGLV
jgi:hypothetical protein